MYALLLNNTTLKFTKSAKSPTKAGEIRTMSGGAHNLVAVRLNEKKTTALYSAWPVLFERGGTGGSAVVVDKYRVRSYEE